MDKKKVSHRWGINADHFCVLLRILPCFVDVQPEYDRMTSPDENACKLKKIAFYNGCDDNRSDRYRVYNVAEELRKKHIIVDIYNAGSIRYLINHVDYDLLVIFREDRYRVFHWYRIEEYLKKNRIPMIYDTDDLIIDRCSSKAQKKILKIICSADALTASTGYLAKKMAEKTRKKTYVIKNTINDRQMTLAKKIARNPEEEKVKIVYQSGTATHNKDFKAAEKALIKVLGEYPNVELHIFGPLDLSDEFAPYKRRIVYHPYMDYLALQIYVSDMDINIAPLQLDEFNHSKSELKIFEAALLRIPTICSPTDSYAAIVKDGINGYIATTDEDWERDLRKLIVDEEERKCIGDKAYEDFVEKFYIGNEIDKIISVYEEIACKKKRMKVTC